MNNFLIDQVIIKTEQMGTLFQVISGQPFAMLLQSAAAQHPDSRYDILVADPLVTMTCKGMRCVIEERNGISQTSDQDPFLLLQQLMSARLPDLQHDELPVSLPFYGGALGYFGYDLGRRIETLPSVATDDIDLPDMAIGLYSWALIADRHSNTCYLVQVRDGVTPVKQLWQQRYAWLLQLLEQNQQQAPFQRLDDWQSNMSAQEYQSKFDQIHSYLRSGDCYQINLAQRFSSHYQGDEWQAYQSLLTQNSAPFSAFIRLQQGAVLSLSPERFISCRQRHIETKPIKGTHPRGKTHEQDMAHRNTLQRSDKDRAENLMIVDLLRNDIGRVSQPGSVKVPKLFDIESFPAVHHMVSTIHGLLDHSYQPVDLLRACFPGGSITGAPKVRAMQIIEELEPHRRNLYCGSIGYLSTDGQMDTSITIRTLLCQRQLSAAKGTIHVWAGGGIVADSKCASEYQETFDKLARILPLL